MAGCSESEQSAEEKLTSHYSCGNSTQSAQGVHSVNGRGPGHKKVMSHAWTQRCKLIPGVK